MLGWQSSFDQVRSSAEIAAGVVAPVFSGQVTMRDLIEPHQTESFFRGYGDTAIDPDALVYYRYARAVEDAGAYGERVFFLPGLCEDSRREAVGGFMQLFEAGNIVALAFAADGAASI
jgi:hypothetical protein